MEQDGLSPTHGKDILIVDDMPDVPELLTVILSADGCQVRHAATGGAALRAAAEKSPDLILLDVKLPDMDGFEVCRRLKSDERSRSIPVLFISAMGETEDKVKGFNAGGVDYLLKPFEPAEVLARIKTHLHIRDLTLSLSEGKELLEMRVHERTAELVRMNQELQAEISERTRAEQEIISLNDQLSLKLAELATANNELETFSYSVSHDLRAPLRSIQGFCEAVIDDNGEQLDQQGRDYLLRIRNAGRRMAELIDGMLKLSRVSRAEMTYEAIDFTALAEEVLDELSRAEPQRRVACSIGRGIGAKGDPQLLRAALQNLLGNAWKFTSKTRDARIEFGTSRNRGSRVFFVRDNGVGFDPAYSDKLFLPFQRLHAISEFPGTGIGLATVQRIIHRHGGRIWAEAEKGKGALFSFTL